MNPLQRYVYYPLLVLISLTLVVWQNLGMERRLTLQLNKDSDIYLNKQLINGQKSSGLLLKQQDKATLFCSSQVQSNTKCALSLKFNQAVKLSDYQQFSIELRFSSSTRDTVLLQLYQQTAAASYHSLQQQNLLPQQGRANYHFSLVEFYQPSWWQLLTADIAAPQQDTINHFSLITGDNQHTKNIELSLHRIELYGKIIAAKDLYLSLLSIWLLSLTVSYFNLNRGLKEQHQQSHKHALELNKMNSYLSIERDNYEFMAKTDPLTSCFNRAGLRNVFSDIIIEYIETNMPSSIVLFDIDHFKKINDNYGHDEGDKVLINIANLVRQQIREGDYLARWGGEEFLVVCTHTRQGGAAALAEHLRQAIEQTMLSQHCRITSSFGVAEISSGFLEQWIKRADEALYQAKQNGRNQVVSAAKEINKAIPPA